MSINEALAGLTGNWTGTNYLWLDSNEPPQESVSMAEVTTAARGNFLTIAYDWSWDGPQDGLIVLNSEDKTEGATSVWLDSFHTAPGLMVMRSTIDEQGIAVLDGHYPAPSGPDWGWRIVVDPTPAPAFHLLMFNISPTGDEFKAVEVVYRQLEPVA